MTAARVHAGAGLRRERSGDLCAITLASPPLNILTIALLDELASALESARAERGLRAVVIAAEGKAFSAGADVSEHLPGTMANMLDAFGRVFRVLYDLPVATIAVVQGAALGGGCELAAFCDIVIASDRAKFGQPEVKLAAFAPVGAAVLPAVVGPRQAARLLLGGDAIDAETAQRIGLVTEVVPHDALGAAVTARLDGMGASSPDVLGRTARELRRVTYPDFKDRLWKLERFYQDEIATLPDSDEGLRAYMEKRAPRWRSGNSRRTA